MLTVAAAVGIALYWNSPELSTSDIRGPGGVRLFTVEVLSQHNSSHPDQIFLSIVGEVFDVTKKPEAYGAKLLISYLKPLGKLH